MSEKIKVTRNFSNIKNSNIFYSTNYKDYLSQFGDYLYLYNDYFVIPLLLVKKYCFRYADIISEPFQYNEYTNASEKDFLNNICCFIKNDLKVHWINCTYAYELFKYFPNKSLRIPFGSYIINLTETEEELFKKINGKHKNVIKKAMNAGVIIKKGKYELIEDYMLLDNETWTRSNRKSYKKSFFINLLNGLKDNISIYISYFEDIPQAGAIIYYNNTMGYYMYGCSASECYNGSGNLLQWEIIKDLKRQEVNKYSLVGCRINEDQNSKYHNIQRFKSRFGGDLFSGYMFKVINNQYKYLLYRLAIRIKSKSNIKDVIDEEINKWKDIN